MRTCVPQTPNWSVIGTARIVSTHDMQSAASAVALLKTEYEYTVHTVQMQAHCTEYNKNSLYMA